MNNRPDNIKQKFNRRLKNDAISPAISLILVLMIFFTSTGAVFLWGPDYIKSEENTNQTKAIVSQYNSVVEALKSIISGGNGSIITSEMVINSGTIEIDSKGERLIVMYSMDPNWNFNVDGLEDDDNTFSINGQSVHNVTIYWLEGTCFLAGTKICMADGSEKNIEDIKVGDVVKSFDEVSGKLVDVRVKKLLSYGKDRMSSDYYVVVNDELKVTPNHKLFVNNKWVEAGKVSVGDVLFDLTGNSFSLFSLEKKFSKEVSFDLLLESGNAYFADGFMVRSDVKRVIVSDSVYISKMSCVATRLCPLGEAQEPGPGVGEDVGQQIGLGRALYSSQDCFISQFPGLRKDTTGCTFGHLRVDPGIISTVQRSLLKFPLNNIPDDAFIEMARLYLYYYRYVENNPVGDTTFVNEVDDYNWQNGDTSWDCWDTSQNKYWDWKLGERLQIRTLDEYPEMGDSTIAEATIPSNYGWIMWGEDSPLDGGMGMTQSVIELWEGQRTNYGWLISGHESAYKTNVFDFYSSRASELLGIDPYNEPKLKVWYVSPPEGTYNQVSNIGETTATFIGYLIDDGLTYATTDTYTEKTHCFYTCLPIHGGYDITTPSINRNSGQYFNYTCQDCFIPGNTYMTSAFAANDAGQEYCFNNYQPFIFFLTKPLSPTSLEAIPFGSSLYLSWNKAQCGVPDDQVTTKILAKKASQGWPSGPEDPSAIEIYNSTGETTTKLLEPNTTYYIRAWTYVNDTFNWEPHLLWQWSTQYVSATGTTRFDDNLPIACFTYTDVDGSGPKTLINFDASCSYDIEGSITNCSWDFEYNPTQQERRESWDAFDKIVSYDYGSTEPYLVRLRVKDSAGQYGYIVQTVHATDPGGTSPIACFSYTDVDGIGPGTLINFDASCSFDLDGSIVNYSWDFGDDGSWDAFGLKVSYNHGSTEPYLVTLRVRDNVGKYGYITNNVLVAGAPTQPKREDFEVFFDPSKFYNDVNYEFSVRSYDSEGDDIYYIFDWGDNNKNWFGPYPANLSIEESGRMPPIHNWDISGVYELRVQAVNDYNIDGDDDPTTNPGPASVLSDPFTIRVYYKYVVPPDTIDSQGIDGGGNPISNPIIAKKDLTGSVCIHLFNKNYPSATDPTKGKVPFGVIYLFDLGSISHSISSASGEYKTILQNGGVLSVLPGGSYVDSYSNIYESGDILGFTVSMIRGDKITAGAGARTYGLSFKNLNTFTREQQGYNVYNFKVKISGDYSNAWYDYLLRNYKFTPQSDMLLYNDNGYGKQLVFSTALIKTNLK